MVSGWHDEGVTATTATLEWFGTATFRVNTKGLTLFFDAYLDRLPGLDPVGLSTAEVDVADFVFVSHAHFDHVCGVEVVARRTGATVVASPESARCLRLSGVPEEQLLVVTGGETVDCGHGVKVRVLPSLHACLFAATDPDSGAECVGDLGVSAQERATAVAGLFAAVEGVPGPVGRSLHSMLGRSSTHDGGQLAFLLTDGTGSVLVSGSAGYWRGIFAGLRPDVALLSVGGRPNVDGEPFQGSVAKFVVEEAGLLGAGRVALCHHDPLFPGLPGVDITATAAALRRETPSIDHLELAYATPVQLFA